MKLWKKISLICGAVLVATVTVATATQLSATSYHMVETTRKTALEKQTRLVRDFNELVSLHRDPNDSEIVRNTLLRYCFSQCDDGTGLLNFNGANLTGKELPDLNAHLREDYETGQLSGIGTAEGRHYLLVASSINYVYSDKDTCTITVLEDVSDVYAQIRKMVIQYTVIALLGIGMGLELIILVVRRSLRPMEDLQKTAAKIAAGNYGERSSVQGQDEVGDLARSFNHMADAVQTHIETVTEAAEKQRLFVGAVTHEFKTPLTGILLNVDNLQNTYMTPEEQEAALTAIETQGQWLERMVQKMLKLLTLSNQFTPADLSAREICQKAAAGARGILRERQVTLKTSCEDFPIRGDGDLLHSAIDNLIDNASKASQPGDVVTLLAGERCIRVCDHGCGIPEEALPHITDAFYMADRSRSKRRGGVGLGLALVQQIVNVHGANLTICSQLGQGTTVTIQFPSEQNEV